MARKKKTLESPYLRYLTKVIEEEYNTAKSNRAQADSDFDAMLDMIELRRTEKNYEWMSDTYYPVFASIFLTECSQWAATMFSTRDFADIFLEGDTDQDLAACQAYKKMLNRTLNRRELYFFQKYLRFRSINGLCGEAWMLLGWVKDIKIEERVETTVTAGYDTETKQYVSMPQEKRTNVKVIKKDCFDCEALDPRNVFTTNQYVYSAQEKDFVIIRHERTLAWLKENADQMGYTGLDEIKESKSEGETSTARETYNERDRQSGVSKPLLGPKMDVLDRYGKVWAVVTERNQRGVPVAIAPGFDELGNVSDKAELVEAIITMVNPPDGRAGVIIRFIPSPFSTTTGELYRPLIRARCYVHPTSDVGMCDAKYSRELQVAINDSFNLGADRAQLATLPTFIVKKYGIEDEMEINIQPEGVIAVENVDDIRELQISDNTRAMLEQIQMLTGQMNQVNAVFPSTLGDMPIKASTTATAAAGADNRSNVRANYKDLTVEHTFLTEFYWMIGQMTVQFMEAETARKLLGADIAVFDPDGDYTFKPITSGIEAEYNKNRKAQSYDQLIGRLGGLAQVSPAVVPIIAHAVAEQLKNLGGEQRTFAPLIENLAKTPPTPGPGATQTADGKPAPTSNQGGAPMSNAEQGARLM